MRSIGSLLMLLICVVPVYAQQPEQTLPTNTAIPSLMLFTLVAALAVAVGAFLYFLRKRSNRAAASRALNPADD